MGYKVDLDKADSLLDKLKNSIKSTYSEEVLNKQGFFNSFFDISKFKSYDNPVMVSCCDGVGTKIKLTCDLQFYEHIGQDLVAMCVNDLITCGATPLQFLDYFATSKLNEQRDYKIINSIALACKKTNCSLIGGEIAEMSGMYQDNEYDLAGFCNGIIEKDKIIDGSKIEKDNYIIGINSNGVHSNGFTLIREILSKLPESIYKDLLKPTYLYDKVVKNLIERLPIKGMAHITGGGLEYNIRRILNKNQDIEFFTYEIPEIFNIIEYIGNITIKIMKEVFNMGIGFIVVVNKKYVEDTLNIIDSNNFQSYIIGKIK